MQTRSLRGSGNPRLGRPTLKCVLTTGTRSAQSNMGARLVDVHQPTVAFIVHHTSRLVWAHLTLAKCPQ